MKIPESMKITVKLFAMLRDKLPPESDGYAFEMEVEAGTVPQDIIDHLEISEQMAHLVMIDGVHQLRSEHRTRVLKPGETVAIFPPVAGG